MKNDLSERNKLIHILRLGLFGNDKHTSKELGILFGISDRQIRNILASSSYADFKDLILSNRRFRASRKRKKKDTFAVTRARDFP